MGPGPLSVAADGFEYLRYDARTGQRTLAIATDDELAAVLELHAVGQAGLIAQRIEQPDDGAGVEAAVGTFFLEPVDLADDADRDDDGVVRELEDRVGIVQQDVRIQYVVLPHVKKL